MVAMALEFIFSLFSIIYFGCAFFGDCENGLICSLYYIKFFQTIYLWLTYKENVKEKQPNHPIGFLNTYIVIVLYYICLYQYVDILKASESPNMVHFAVVYVIIDGILIIISFFTIRRVKSNAKKLIDDPQFKEYKQEAELALADILYLPQEFESDDGEEEL